jgi:N-acetylglucosamine-6-phosphate deacetylase
MKPPRRDRLSLFDIQVNGFAGVDFQLPRPDPAAIRHACEALRRHGTHRILLTLVTDSIDSLEEKFARFEAIRAADPLIRETVPGYHLEGPYLNPADGFRGAHPKRHVKAPDLREYRRLQKAAGGNIRLVTLAPEWPGSGRFIAALSRAGVVTALGHTDANAKEIDRAVAAGARLCTHLGNGCPSTLDRHDNIIQRLLARDELSASFIPDGIHLPPFVLSNLVRAKPAGKVILTTDAMAAAGAPAGKYTIAGITVECGKDRVVRLPGTPYFAGSSLEPDTGVANAARFAGVPLATARAWASSVPAAVFGIRLPKI